MPKYKSENNTNISLTYCFNELLKLIPSFSKTEFAKFLNTTRQNLGQRLLRNSKLTENERISLKNIKKEKNYCYRFGNCAGGNCSGVRTGLHPEQAPARTRHKGDNSNRR